MKYLLLFLLVWGLWIVWLVYIISTDYQAVTDNVIAITWHNSDNTHVSSPRLPVSAPILWKGISTSPDYTYIYGEFTGDQIMYSGKQIAILSWRRLIYNNISIQIPEKIVLWMYPIYIEDYKYWLFYLKDNSDINIFTSYHDLPYLRPNMLDQNITLSLRYNIHWRSEKDICRKYEDGPLPGDWYPQTYKAEKIKKFGTTLYIYYTIHADDNTGIPTRWWAELCALKNNMYYNISLHNYKREEAEKILSSFEIVE